MLTYIQIGIAVLLTISILLQQRGGGLSSTFGGGMMEYSTKRGAEKIIFYASIVLTVLFLTIAVVRLFL